MSASLFRRTLSAVATALLGLTVVTAAPAAAVTPPDVQVTFTLHRFVELDPIDPLGGGSGDFYAQVAFGTYSNRLNHEDRVESSDFSPEWTFTQTVPYYAAPFEIIFFMWDSDPPGTPHDVADINPEDGVQGMAFDVDPAHGIVSSGNPRGYGPTVRLTLTGDGDTEHLGNFQGGNAAQAFISISVTGIADTDGDGITDAVELGGIRDADGSVSFDLAARRSDPCRKTILLEIDWMTGAPDGHSHRPKPEALAELEEAFATAPVAPAASCPYPGFPSASGGIQMIVDIGNSIPEREATSLEDMAAIRDDGNFDPARRPYVHYVMFAHDLEIGSSTSGVCCESNRDFLVTLGRWTDQVGSVREQSATIMHELGHSLGIDHGGNTGRNYKPNYLSVMNYSFDPMGIPDPTLPAPNIDLDRDGVAETKARLDYSDRDLPTLDETNLDEAAGIGGATDGTRYFDPQKELQFGPGSGPIDWSGGDADGNGDPLDDTGVIADINGDGVCVAWGEDETLQSEPSGDDVVLKNAIWDGPDRICDSIVAEGSDDESLPPGTGQPSILAGFDDWSNLQFRAAIAGLSAGPSTGHPGDITVEQADEVRRTWLSLFTPDLTVVESVSQPAATPGDTVTFTATVRNEGTGLATEVSLEHRLPDGSTAVVELGKIAARSQASRAFSFTIPHPAGDRSTFTASATVSGLNAQGLPERDTSDNASSASVRAEVPILSFGKTATSQAQGGETITYTLTFRNTGSGDAEGVTITDTLPAGVWYSPALDDGAGPAPTSFTRNADGTTELTWDAGHLPGGSGPVAIELTARPSLLVPPSTILANAAVLTFTDGNGNDYPSLDASAHTTIVESAPSRDPLGLGYWRNHVEAWTVETRARIAATDFRWDAADGSAHDGALSVGELEEALSRGGQPKVLGTQLAATYLNVATRRVNPTTVIVSPAAASLGLATVGDAIRYARMTLSLPYDENRSRYGRAAEVLDEVNRNASPVY